MKHFTALITTALLLMSLASCKSEKKTDANPFFAAWDTPYGVPPFDKIRAEHFKPALERGMSLQDADIAAITSDKDAPSFENTIVAYDNSGELLAQVDLVMEMLGDAETTPELQAVEEEMLPKLSAQSDKILMDKQLFGRIETVYKQRSSLGLDSIQMRLLQKTYTEFVRAGALLSDKDKDSLKSINAQLASVSVKYGNNILAENNKFALVLTDEEKDLAGLPQGVKDAAQATAKEMGKGDKAWVFTLHQPSLIPFLTYSSRRDLREELYKAYLSRCNHNDEYDNKQNIEDFIRLRTEKAHLLGYKSYADYVVADEMAGTTDAVYKLLDQIWTPALDCAKAEVAEMLPLLQRDVPNATFESWDWWYYAEQVRKQKYDLDEEMVRPYLSLDNVQHRIFYLANRLYGITFRPIVVPVYQKDVVAFEVLDADRSHLGVLYFDFYPRAGKSQGAWCGNYVEQTYKDGKRVPPVVSLVFNFTSPIGKDPALLSIDETQTMFHEFGHALNFLFHKVKYRGLTEVEGDFVEMPSQVMENWALEPAMLKQYAVNYRTGEVIPQSLIDKLRNSLYFNQGFMTTELTAAALSDMDIHSMQTYAPFDPMTFEHAALYDKRGLIPQIEPRYHYPYFSHIFDGGYSAGYYFYLWSEVLDRDTFKAFVDSGDIFNKQMATDFRNKILSQGGQVPGMTMYRAFRGQDPDVKALLQARGLIPQDSVSTVESGKLKVDSLKMDSIKIENF